MGCFNPFLKIKGPHDGFIRIITRLLAWDMLPMCLGLDR